MFWTYNKSWSKQNRNIQFLGAFVKLRKATVSFAMSILLSVCLSARPHVRMEQLVFHRAYFHEILYLSIFRKSVKKMKISLNSDKKNGYFMNTDIHLWSYRTQFSEWENLQTKVEKIKTNFMFNFFFRKSCRLWENVEKYCISGHATDDSIAHALFMMAN
jgi:hypothetical protein